MFRLCLQGRTLKLKAMWSHQKRWKCWKSIWRKRVDRYSIYSTSVVNEVWLSLFYFFIYSFFLDPYPFSSRAKRHPSHRACQSHQLQLWLCKSKEEILFDYQVRLVIIAATVTDFWINLFCRQTMEFVSWGMMTQILRKRKRSTSLRSRRWWSGSVSLTELDVIQ